MSRADLATHASGEAVVAMGYHNGEKRHLAAGFIPVDSAAVYRHQWPMAWTSLTVQLQELAPV